MSRPGHTFVTDLTNANNDNNNLYVSNEYNKPFEQNKNS